MHYPTAIASLCDSFALDFHLTPVIGAELECYFRNEFGRAPDSLVEPLRELLESHHIPLYKVEQERGEGQVEIVFREQEDILGLVETITRTRQLLSDFVKARNLRLLLDAKPFPDQPGSGLHVHVSLHDEQGHNSFFKRNEIISDPLKYALGGLLAALPESMRFFAPKTASYGRFCGAKDAPTTISWGANNRTTALRLPESRDGLKHLEHRVPGADAEIEETIFAILAGVHYGLSHRVDPGAQTYSNAFDPRAALPLLPANLDAALECFEQRTVLADYLG